MKHRLLFTNLLATLLTVFTFCTTKLMAQDAKVTISSISCSQAQSSNPIKYAYDGNTSTFWHSPWGSITTTFPVTLTIKLKAASHVDYVRYVPRQDGNSNGNWKSVTVQTSTNGTTYTDAVTTDLGGSSSSSDIDLGTDGMDDVSSIRIKVNSGSSNYASAAEIEVYVRDNTKSEAFKQYFDDALCTQLKSSVTTAEGIEDADVKALVSSMLTDAKSYKKFRVGEYEAYRTTSSLQSELRTASQYNQYENPTGIYATSGKVMYLFVEGIGDYPVKLSVKNWVTDESGSSYNLRNGYNAITPTTTGNTFINYYTDDFEKAPNVRCHFVNGQVQGYWDQATMTNDDWKEIMKLHPSSTDSTIIICRSEHAQTAYPAYIWRQNCPTNIDSTMTLYEEVQWAERDIMGLKKYNRECKNRQLFYGTTYGFMAAGGTGAYCNVTSLSGVTKPDAANFDFWGIGHEWGHNNQITPGFKWTGCGETTNNIYASWAQIHFTGTPNYLRLEDEVTGVNDYSSMRGGRMETYFEEGLRKGVQWQLQDGPDYHGTEPGSDGGRNYDHFVKLVPFWQLNLWGTLAGKCPDLIPMIIEGLRNTNSSTLSAMSNGKMQLNWIKLACDSAKINLLPFFEKAGMLKEINKVIYDYSNQNTTITTAMINTLKKQIAAKNYPEMTEEVNYINGHNWQIYRDCLPLEVPTKLGDGCTISGTLVKVLHSKVKNAVAYETYNSDSTLIRITMYGLGSDNNHTYTQVLYPGSEDAAYIMAVGYDGTRMKIFEYSVPVLKTRRFYTIKSNSKGGYLDTKNCSVAQDGTVTQNVARVSSFDAKNAAAIWYAESKDDKMYLQNPQSGLYLGGTSGSQFSEFYNAADAAYFVADAVNAANNTWTLALNGSGQYLNSYSSTNTGYWSGGSGDANNVWVIDEVKTISVNVPATGYRALNYPFGLQVPDGYTAYIATDLQVEGDTTYVMLHDLGSVIPSNTPAILQGTAGIVDVTLVDDYSDPQLDTSNVLSGYNLKCTGFTSGEYMLLVKGDPTPYFKASTSTYTTPNFCYLLSDKLTQPTTAVLHIDDTPIVPTAITTIKSSTNDAPVYDLSGRRVARPVKGIYVRNGKKIIK